MKKKSFFALLAAVVAATSLLATSASATVVTQQPTIDVKEEVTITSEQMTSGEFQKEKNKQLKYRLENNLSTSDEAILKAMNDPNAERTKNTYSISLTAEEEAYINERDKQMLEYKTVILNIVRGENEFNEVGTFYQVTNTGLKFIVGFSKENEEVERMKSELEKAVPQKLLVIKKVTNSERELIDVYRKISSEKGYWTEQGVQISGLSLSVKDDIVKVSINPFTDEDRSQLEAYYGNDKIQVKQSNEKIELLARTSKFDTMVGGLAIATTSANSTSDPDCSTGFTATKGTDRFVVTAGHCTYGSTTWYQGGESIGSTHYTYMGESADVGLIKVSGTKYISNYVYKYSGFDSNYVNYETNHSWAVVGDKVCMSGSTSGFQCGEVTDVYASGVYGDSYIKSTIQSAGGDSGGTIWYSGFLKGIVHAGSTDSATGIKSTIYTHVADAMAFGGSFTPYTSSTAK